MGRHPLLVITFLFILLAVTVIAATGMGYLKIAPGEVVSILWAKLTGLPPATDNPTNPFVVWEVRLPRILTAALVGGCLAVAGGVFQAILLNPLADPYTLGISSGAAFGASLVIILSILGINVPHWFSIPAFAFAGGLATLAAVFSLARSNSSLSSNSLILSGVIIAAILSAGIGFIKYLADEQVSIIIFWLMGSFVGRDWQDVQTIAVIAVPAFFFIFYYARDLNIMSLGEKSADTLGVDSVRTKRRLLVCASLITAVSVSVSGIIGFIGLIIPHLLRMILGPDNRYLLPACFLAGSVLLLGADTVTRAWLPSEIPIGVLTSLIGGPFFCYIFRKKQMGRSR